MQNFIQKNLSFKDFEVLITSDFPNEKACVIANSLLDVYVIVPSESNFITYILQPNLSYTCTKIDTKGFLIPSITQLLETSFKKLSSDERNEIKEKYSKSYHGIFHEAAVNKYFKEIVQKLIRENIEWDKTLCQIHFNNGYMDLNDLKFKQRQLGVHYITHFIARDYTQSTKEQRSAVLKPVELIYPNKDDRECVLMSIGSALSGLSSKEQDTLFLLGQGSSGKSFILTLTEASIGCYFKELKSDTFTSANAKADKILNTFQSNKQIRISWVNEMEDARIDASLFKKFCDGQLTTTVLYKDGSFTVPHYSKAIVTANTMPNIKVDTGVSRRFRGYTHKSNFTDNIAEVDISKNVYIKDKDLLENIIKDNLMDAWFDVLALKCHSWIKGAKIQFTANFDETRDTVILCNDWCQDFIDVHLKITGEEHDRIGKTVMHERLKLAYPSKLLSPLQLITCLKDKKIQYDPKARCDKLQGCFIGVRFQSELDDDFEHPLDKGVLKDDYKAKYEDAMKQIEALKRQLLNVNCENRTARQQEIQPTKPSKSITVSPKALEQVKTADDMDKLIDDLMNVI
jgi:hypothetical protein